MTVAKYTDSEGFTFRVFSSMYVDWGLEIKAPDGNDLYYSPSSMCNEAYGHKPNPKKYEDWDEAEQASFEGDSKAFVPWNQKDWKECLESEADTFLEAYVLPEILEKYDST